MAAITALISPGNRVCFPAAGSALSGGHPPGWAHASVQWARCAIDHYKPAPDGRGAPPPAPPPPSDPGPWLGVNGVTPGASGPERRSATIPPFFDRTAPLTSGLRIWRIP